MDVRSDRLVKEVSRVRETFAAHSARELIGRSKDANEQKIEVHLRNLQLSAWTLKDAETYLDGSWSQDPNSLRRVLPRLAELMANDPHGNQLLSGATRRLAQAKYWDWPAPERKAIAGFFSAYWQHLLVTRVPWEISLTTIASLALVLEDLGAELAAWRDSSAHDELRRLAAFVVEWCRHVRPPPKPGDALQARAAQNLERLDEWLHSAEMRAALERAFYAASAPGEGEELSKAVEHLEQTAH